jgi:cyanophycinase
MASACPILHAQEFFERFDAWPVELRIQGTILLAPSPSGMAQYLNSNELKLNEIDLVLIDLNGTPTTNPEQSDRSSLSTELLSRFASVKQIPVVTSEATESDSKQLVIAESLADLKIHETTMLLVMDNSPPDTIRPPTWDLLKKVFQQTLDAQGIIGWAGPSFRALGSRYHQPRKEPPVQEGLNLFPDAFLCLQSPSDSSVESIHEIMAPEWKCVALHVAKENTLILKGRKIRTFGPAPLQVIVPARDELPASEQTIVHLEQDQRQRNLRAEDYLLDWTQWRRLALERTLDRFPKVERITPEVPSGSLIIIGGGATPREAMNQFVLRAGGKDAKLVYVPCLETEDLSGERDLIETWRRMGVENCELLHTKDRIRANHDSSFLEPLRDATGIWFGGGRQWNLADSYYGTEAHRLMKQVLARGGVIAGSSAGASIQSEYLARATPIENFRIMAPGYERGGLGFIRGVAIDQHFTQRNRQKDLQSLVETYPQILGIGIDESTAIIVEKSTASVIGRGQVYFYWIDPEATSKSEFVGKASDRFNLATRATLEPQTQAPQKD